jgi:ABC-type sugar transport system substrate-binding protein
MMRSRTRLAILLVVAAVVGLCSAPAASAQDAEPLEVGAVAPDFALPGATRYGILEDQVHLSDYAGKTVVLAFFFKARTRG